MTTPSTSDAHDIIASVVRALMLYTLAEFQSGHCSTIRIEADDGAFSIEDDGRGHAIARTVAGAPYLKFIYTHLDYPFAPPQDAPIQLQGIGMSLINVLCCEFTVTVRKQAATLRLSFQGGRLCDEEFIEVKSQRTGNIISGMIAPEFRQRGFDKERLQKWLREVLIAHPTLNLFFNGEAIYSSPPGFA
jgi:DNA gyrase/topoisomerase IV subunit B